MKETQMLCVDGEFGYWMLPMHDWMSSVIGQPRVLLTVNHTNKTICIQENVQQN